MANKKFWLGMLAMLLVFGMIVVFCGCSTFSTHYIDASIPLNEHVLLYVDERNFVVGLDDDFPDITKKFNVITRTIKKDTIGLIPAGQHTIFTLAEIDINSNTKYTVPLPGLRISYNFMSGERYVLWLLHGGNKDNNVVHISTFENYKVDCKKLFASYPVQKQDKLWSNHIDSINEQFEKAEEKFGIRWRK